MLTSLNKLGNLKLWRHTTHFLLVIQLVMLSTTILFRYAKVTGWLLLLVFWVVFDCTWIGARFLFLAIVREKSNRS
jgi:hypothetical protein